MILIFGGTTEGRIASQVCDRTSKSFYYSTKNNYQQVECLKGIRLSGAMDEQQMELFCVKNNITMLIDAAHPFAENLHKTITSVSNRLNIPVVRYERHYPVPDDYSLWFEDFNHAVEYLINNNFDNLLALTGVNSIERLKPYWQNHNCWLRILNRKESLDISDKYGFPRENLLFYQQGEDDHILFSQLQPDAIITKESGESGGFGNKIAVAKELNIPVLVIKRPLLSDKWLVVTNEDELRSVIENS